MQRLFSIFPSGTAGTALLLLRVLVAILVLVDGSAHWALITSFWIGAVFVLPAALLCAGLLTPYVASLGLLILAGVLVLSPNSDAFHLSCAILTCVVLALLGPGAYSFDARLFGRRVLTVSSRE
ncbi:putative membrane protein YphA (DoxX/SURF4 family) [Granulicella aggregans]|uniref:Putative membrane protein YphA (DoxX/SURF4 family) n=1 Tax=Granulicella aggregans TaxID=474949 RepID=A0A7W7ZJI6_9BACT|nr:hypothetical protein [Granulicella aggregans]MBB5060898.1 putative membrane protein YphA (DoxX/SURF4 family) [Granulicella aggregans]